MQWRMRKYGIVANEVDRKGCGSMKEKYTETYIMIQRLFASSAGAKVGVGIGIRKKERSLVGRTLNANVFQGDGGRREKDRWSRRVEGVHIDIKFASHEGEWGEEKICLEKLMLILYKST